MPHISVIIPVYKVEAYLRRCVDSVLLQTFDDYEIILVDDGSPDNSGLICDEYAMSDSRIHVIHQENGGLSAARNAGIDWMFSNSDSQWVTFVDSDDWIHRDYLKIMYEAVTEHESRLGVCGIYRTTGGEFPENAEKEVLYLQANDFYTVNREGILPVPACGKLYHKSLFHSLRFPVGKIHEDEFLTYRTIFDAEKVTVCTAYLYAYFQNQNGITRSKWSPRRLDGLEAIEQQLEFAQHSGNDKFHRIAFDKLVWVLLQQIDQLKEQVSEDETGRKYLRLLRKRLRQALRTKRYRKWYSLSRDTLPMYKEAYPLECFWNLAYSAYRLLKKSMFFISK